MREGAPMPNPDTQMPDKSKDKPRKKIVRDGQGRMVGEVEEGSVAEQMAKLRDEENEQR